MKEHGILPAELAEAFGKSKASAKAGRPAKTIKSGLVKKPVAPKYRHPGSGATWTGRGKAPLWVVEAEKNGQSRQQFLI
ncbi:MAG: H-NS histone family protein, partial [Alcaligenaceae bacterium]|nr:H-NS histone family protein [Alcaligenaceae bacterium]